MKEHEEHEERQRPRRLIDHDIAPCLDRSSCSRRQDHEQEQQHVDHEEHEEGGSAAHPSVLVGS